MKKGINYLLTIFYLLILGFAIFFVIWFINDKNEQKELAEFGNNPSVSRDKSFELDKSIIYMYIGDKYHIAVKNYTKKELVLDWSSDEDRTATVSDNGVVEATSPGKTTIEVTSKDGDVSKVEIVVVDPEETTKEKAKEEDFKKAKEEEKQNKTTPSEPTPEPEPTPAPTPTPTPEPTPSPTPTPTPDPEPEPTPTPTPTPKPEPEPTPTPTPDPEPTPTPEPEPTPEPTPTPTDVCEQAKLKGTVDYKDFKKYKKDNDDYYVIKEAHDCANKYNLPVVVTKATYNIYKYVDGNVIKIETNTDFGGSTFYIHDEKLVVNDEYKYDGDIFKVYDNTHPGFKLTLSSSLSSGTLVDIPSKVKETIANKLNEKNETLSGYLLIVTDTNENRKIFK